MPGKRQYELLAKAGIDVCTSPYDRVDCLEDRNDLEALFGVLVRHRNMSGQSPCFTFNTIMGNPDFQAIRDSAFQKFFRQDLFESYLHYHGDDLRPTWNQAMREGLIRPQFHGREHLNVELWLSDLKAGRPETRIAFDHNYYGLLTRTSSPKQRNYLAAFWPQSQSHFFEIKNIIAHGLVLFEELFGYQSKSFIPCNFILPEELEADTAQMGVELIQGQRGQIRPSSDGSEVSMRRSYTGERNGFGQIYTVRNVRFEPFEDLSRDWVSSAMRDIKSAFYWRTPAIISTHRVNYVGRMSMKHRDRNLKLLDTLLGNILSAWPDVEFVSTDELIRIMGS